MLILSLSVDRIVVVVVIVFVVVVLNVIVVALLFVAESHYILDLVNKCSSEAL